MKKVKLIAIDLDGTMLDRDSTLPEENRQAAVEALAAGLEVVIVTGRSWRATKEFYEAMGLTGPAICYLGGLLIHGATEQILQQMPMPPEAWETLRVFAVRESIAVTACVAPELLVEEGALPAANLLAADTAFSTCRANDFGAWDEWNPYTEISPDLSACRLTPMMLAVYGDEAVRRTLAAFPAGLPGCQFDLHDRVEGNTVLHIWHKDIDKGKMLAQYCAQRGIEAAEVMAMGDAPMDLPMIRFAGIGVAVPDAHDLLKAEADWVMSPAEAIRRAVRGQIP